MLLNFLKVRLLDQEAGKDLGNLVTGYSRDYQVESVPFFKDKLLYFNMRWYVT